MFTKQDMVSLRPERMMHPTPPPSVQSFTPDELSPTPNESGIARFEWVIGCLVIALLVLLRIQFAQNAGGLWRDEVHSVDVARNSQFPMWQDSFPILWIATLRSWINLTGRADDLSMRFVGLLCGLIMLAASIWAPQGRRRHIPWITLVLFGMSPVVIMYGTEVRGYALGAATQFWMLGAMHRWLMRPGFRTGILLSIASLVAVQAAYANSFLLLAGSMAAAIVCYPEKRWKDLLYLGINGIVCAATVAPYALYVFPKWSNDWIVVVRQNFPVQWYFDRLIESVGLGGWISLAAWIILGSLAIYGVIRGYFEEPQSKSAASAADGHPGVFEAWLAVIGSTLVFGYLKWLKVHTSEWYYMPMMALWAFCFDSILANGWKRENASLLRVGLAGIVAASQFPFTWSATTQRMTNVDLAAKTVSQAATDRDLVVVIPWIVGIPMQRYYDGPAPWLCLPEIKQTDVPGILIHGDGYRAVKNMMMREDALSLELARVRETLQHGGRVFVVGSLRHAHKGKSLQHLPAAPNSKYGWSDSAYQNYWTHLLEVELNAHSQSIEKVALASPAPINQHEECEVSVATGRSLTQRNP